uniref:Uncharacterized protein n=1 Tax=Anguilla anguilla TaxID=7936 RepID=A0A0E9RBK9_ANGAN
MPYAQWDSFTILFYNRDKTSFNYYNTHADLGYICTVFMFYVQTT